MGVYYKSIILFPYKGERYFNMNMKKILVSLVAGAVMTTAFALSAMATEITVTNSAEFLEAVSATGTAETIILDNDIVLDAPADSLDPGARVIEIPCTINLNDNTLDLSNIQYLATWVDATIKNGTIAVKNTNSGILSVYRDNLEFTLDDVVIEQKEGYNIDNCTNLIQIHNKDCIVNINDCEISAETGYGLVVANNTSGAKINITDSVLKTNSKSALFGGEYVITNSEITANQYPIRNADGTTMIIDSEIIGLAENSAITTRNDGKVYTIGDSVINVADSAVEKAVAMIGDEPYATLQDAIAAADDGVEIILLNDITLDELKIKEETFTLNLNGNTLYIADSDADKCTRINHINGANVTYKNGTINIDDANASVAIFGLNVYEGTVASTVTFANVVVEGDEYNSGYAVFYLNAIAGNKMVVTNSEIYLANEKGASGGVFKAENKDTVLEISDTVMVLDNIKRGFVNMTTALTDTEIEFKNLNKTALRDFNGVIAGSYITVDGAEYGIENTSAGLSVEIKASAKNPSVIKVLKSEEEGIYLAAGNEITVANDGSELLAESVYVADGSEIGGNFVSKADTIEVVFEKVDEEEVNGVMVDNAEGEDLYNINLVGSKEEIINRLNSADLTFTIANTTGKTSYEIIASNEEVAINPVNNSDDRYEFHFNGKTEVETDTANIITIGQVKFSGYGIYTFSVDAEADTNVAHATTISDNIVDTFVPNDTATDDAGELIIDDSVTAEIFVPTRELIINIDFPNTVNNNDAAYQDMTVTVSGADLETDLVIELGDNGDITDLAKFVTKTSADKAVTAVFEGGAYKVTITDLLNVNTTYTVTVEGAGYRTARYNVTMNCEESKTLNFWNNVKDNAIEVEVGKETSEKNVTFLAGDIVKDSLINIYDLSAVVSYFGEIELDEDNKPEYAKYDLNRDGKIDSKDVAYVLVSWNN